MDPVIHHEHSALAVFDSVDVSILHLEHFHDFRADVRLGLAAYPGPFPIRCWDAMPPHTFFYVVLT